MDRTERPPDSAQDGDTKNITFANSKPGPQSSSTVGNRGASRETSATNSGSGSNEHAPESPATPPASHDNSPSTAAHSSTTSPNSHAGESSPSTTTTTTPEQPMPEIDVVPSPAFDQPIPDAPDSTPPDRRIASAEPSTTIAPASRREEESDDDGAKEKATKSKRRSTGTTSTGTGDGKEAEGRMKKGTLQRTPSTFDELEDSNRQYIQQLSDSRRQNDELRREVDSLLERLRINEGNERRLGAELASERETLKRERKQSCENLEHLEKELKAVREELNNKDKQIAELKDASAAEASNHQRNMDSVNANNLQNQEERRQLIATQERLNDELQTALRHIDDITAALVAERLAAEQRIKLEIERHNTISNDYIDSLYQQMDEMQNEVEHLRAELAHTGAQLAAYHSKPMKDTADFLDSNRCPRPPPR